jgi:hypothetical protein
VREEGGDLALAVVLRSVVREAWERVGGAQERGPRVEVLALTVVGGLVLDVRVYVRSSYLFFLIGPNTVNYYGLSPDLATASACDAG